MVVKEDVMDVWVVHDIEQVLAVCELENTANRVKAEMDAAYMNDIEITKDHAYKINGMWYMPGNFEEIFPEDTASPSPEAIYQSMLDAGFTKDDLKAIKNLIK